MKVLFEDLGWISFILSIVRVSPICQTGNTDRSGPLRWGLPMRDSGSREETKKEVWLGRT
jgi:hypothetical protein